MKYNPEICGKISAEDEKAVFDGLLKYNMEYLEDKEPKDLGIYIRDENHQVKAGLIGLTHGIWRPASQKCGNRGEKEKM